MEKVTIDLQSKHPDLPEYTRKATVLRTYKDDVAEFATLEVEIQYYLNGELVNNPNGVVRTFQFALRADNSVFVDPTTGAYVPENTPGAMGEYAFITYLESLVLPYSNEQFKINTILRAEQQGRFNG
jgi:hypothetical protein